MGFLIKGVLMRKLIVGLKSFLQEIHPMKTNFMDNLQNLLIINKDAIEENHHQMESEFVAHLDTEQQFLDT